MCGFAHILDTFSTNFSDWSLSRDLNKRSRSRKPPDNSIPPSLLFHHYLFPFHFVPCLGVETYYRVRFLSVRVCANARVCDLVLNTHNKLATRNEIRSLKRINRILGGTDLFRCNVRSVVVLKKE